MKTSTKWFLVIIPVVTVIAFFIADGTVPLDQVVGTTVLSGVYSTAALFGVRWLINLSVHLKTAYSVTPKRSRADQVACVNPHYGPMTPFARRRRLQE
jgi:hypothetical protein